MLLDDLDRRLIALLQADARTSAADLARQLGVARTTVLARLARLEKQSVIVGYTQLARQVGSAAAGIGLQQGNQAAVQVVKQHRKGRGNGRASWGVIWRSAGGRLSTPCQPCNINVSTGPRLHYIRG